MGERGVMVGLGRQQNVAIAARNPLVHYSEPTVHRWNRRFDEEGYEGLKTRHRSGRPKTVSDEDIVILRALVLARPMDHLKSIIQEDMPHLIQHMRAVYAR